MAPIFTRATNTVLTRRMGGNDIVAVTLLGLSAVLIVIAIYALNCILPCTLVKRETLLARRQARQERRNRLNATGNGNGNGNGEAEEGAGANAIAPAALPAAPPAAEEKFVAEAHAGEGTWSFGSITSATSSSD